MTTTGVAQRGMVRRILTAGFAVALGGVLLTGCGGKSGEPGRAVPGGNARRGEVAIQKYGCGSCHVIPGIAGANGMVGPPLTNIAQRVFIAGEVSNTPEHMIAWIVAPQAIEPGTAMPDLGISEQEARDIAAYLYTLE